jgi:hypothetical protein
MNTLHNLVVQGKVLFFWYAVFLPSRSLWRNPHRSTGNLGRTYMDCPKRTNTRLRLRHGPSSGAGKFQPMRRKRAGGKGSHDVQSKLGAHSGG